MNIGKFLSSFKNWAKRVGPFESILFLIFLIIVVLPVLAFFASAIAELWKPVPEGASGAVLEIAILFLNSVIIALSVSLLSLIIGASLAFLISRTNLALRKTLKVLCFVPFFIPPYIQAYAWLLLLGKKGTVNLALMKILSLSKPPLSIYGVKGTIFVLTLSYFPIVMFLTSAGLSMQDPALEESASLFGSQAKVTKRISLPLVFPHLISGFILTFILAISQFSVPGLLEAKTYAVDLFVQMSSFLNESRVALSSIPLFLTAILIILVLRKTLERGFFIVSSAGRDQKPITLSKAGQLLGIAFVLMILFLAVVFPLGELIRQTKTVSVFLKAIAASADAIVFSIITAAAAALIITMLSYYLSSKASGTRKELPVRIAAICLLLIPGAIVGIGMIKLWNHRSTEFVYSSPLIIIVVYVALFIPYGILALISNRKQIDKSLDDAAAICGAGRFAITRRIHMPLLRSGLEFSLLVAFALCLSELTATILVIPPGRESISLRVFSLMHYGESALVAATAIIPILIFGSALLLFSATRLIGKSWK